MTNIKQQSGQCLCTKVSFTASSVDANIGACHCNMCRTWGGGPLLAVDSGDSVAFQGEENISIFDSSEWAERGFCNQCGTHLFYRLKQTGQTFIPAGLFEKSEFTLDHQVFIDEKPDYYCFSNKTHNMTGAEVFAKYAPPE